MSAMEDLVSRKLFASHSSVDKGKLPVIVDDDGVRSNTAADADGVSSPPSSRSSTPGNISSPPGARLSTRSRTWS